MDSRTREIPDDPGSPLPALAERSRAPRRPLAHAHSGRPLAAVAAVVALALLSVALFGMFGPRLSRGPAGGGRAKATATSIKPTATPVQIPGLVIDSQTGLPADMKNTGFSQMQAFGPSDLWGLGYYWQTPRSKTSPSVSYAFFGHFDGRRWSIWPVPLANIALTSFSMDSDTDGWAVGSLTSVDFAHGVLVHFAHGAVTLTQVPGAGILYNVQMLSATEGWAVGNAPSDNTQFGVALNAVTLHYLNGSWSMVSNTLYPEGAVALSLDSAGHGWILSGRGHLGYLAGGAWAQWPQTFAGDYLSSVSSLAPNDAWAVGRTEGTSTSEPAPVVLHFDGHSWSRVTIPALSQSAGAMPSQVTMANYTDGWMSGELLGPLSTTQPQGETAMLLHYDGSQWRSVAPPQGVAFTSISMSSSSDGWAMGWNPPSGSYTYLCHYAGGAWSVVTRFG